MSSCRRYVRSSVTKRARAEAGVEVVPSRGSVRCGAFVELERSAFVELGGSDFDILPVEEDDPPQSTIYANKRAWIVRERPHLP
ncbi:MAG: hypothetical protein ACJAYU_001714 [Bradymonadia bacterium]|jgi:hypothetical protein